MKSPPYQFLLGRPVSFNLEGRRTGTVIHVMRDGRCKVRMHAPYRTALLAPEEILAVAWYGRGRSLEKYLSMRTPPRAVAPEVPRG